MHPHNDAPSYDIICMMLLLEQVVLVGSERIALAAVTLANFCNSGCCVQENQRDRLNIKVVDFTHSQCSARITLGTFLFISQ